MASILLFVDVTVVTVVTIVVVFVISGNSLAKGEGVNAGTAPSTPQLSAARGSTVSRAPIEGPGLYLQRVMESGRRFRFFSSRKCL